LARDVIAFTSPHKSSGLVVVDTSIKEKAGLRHDGQIGEGCVGIKLVGAYNDSVTGTFAWRQSIASPYFTTKKPRIGEV
jgi:hypothetical protein